MERAQSDSLGEAQSELDPTELREVPAPMSLSESRLQRYPEPRKYARHCKIRSIHIGAVAAVGGGGLIVPKRDNLGRSGSRRDPNIIHDLVTGMHNDLFIFSEAVGYFRLERVALSEGDCTKSRPAVMIDKHRPIVSRAE